jgi:hypothetical protein
MSLSPIDGNEERIQKAFFKKNLQIANLTIALERMLAMHDLMMKKVNHAASFYDPEFIKEMNEAPAHARRQIDLCDILEK